MGGGNQADILDPGPPAAAGGSMQRSRRRRQLTIELGALGLGLLVVLWFTGNFDSVRDVVNPYWEEHEMLDGLAIGQSVAEVSERLGDPVLQATGPGGQRESIYMGRTGYVQTISDHNNVVQMLFITSCFYDFDYAGLSQRSMTETPDVEGLDQGPDHSARELVGWSIDGRPSAKPFSFVTRDWMSPTGPQAYFWGSNTVCPHGVRNGCTGLPSSEPDETAPAEDYGRVQAVMDCLHPNTFGVASAGWQEQFPEIAQCLLGEGLLGDRLLGEGVSGEPIEFWDAESAQRCPQMGPDRAVLDELGIEPPSVRCFVVRDDDPTSPDFTGNPSDEDNTGWLDALRAEPTTCKSW